MAQLVRYGVVLVQNARHIYKGICSSARPLEDKFLWQLGNGKTVGFLD